MTENSNSSNPTPETPPAQPVREIHHHHYKDRGTGSVFRFFFGLVVIFLGLALLAQNFGIVPDLELGPTLWKFWPVLIVLLGLSLLARRGFLGGLISFLVIIIVLGLMVFVVLKGPAMPSAEVDTQTFEIARQELADRLELRLHGGAGKINISGGSDFLVSGKHESNFTKLQTKTELAEPIQKVELSTEGRWLGLGRKNVNNLEVKINSEIPAKLDIDSGASDLNFDLSDMMVSDVEIDTGASNFIIALGEKMDNMNIDIDAGASSLNLSVPRSLGVRMVVDAGLSSKSFPEFQKLEDKVYESDNYGIAEKKVNVKINAGASSINVMWK